MREAAEPGCLTSRERPERVPGDSRKTGVEEISSGAVGPVGALRAAQLAQ